ncbi:helix-turn-helix transcriptional regulator [Paenirhodobacter populi]|uniref:Helix-turn-helix transcriptional regulator n=1 Tax=Paenirhodobacter populi TaxID=2306993 RepID=A0A443IP21_9RHOB|nr:helix-turn-helix transcriptional regulator [Sinirhodobacter populi]RWR08166.1 helix-turn-helix transcriptional regulator [Sinirhodobacter populi]
MQTQVDDSDLIELIYASLLGESSWQDFLDRLTRMAPGCWSVLHANDLANGEASVGLVSGRSVGDVADYATYYHHISPWVKYCQADPTGAANVVERNVPGHMLERSEFYTDFLRPIETRSAIGIGVDREGERSLIVSLMTPRAVEDELLPLAQRLNRIAPHLMRAGEFYRRTSFAAQTTELGATFFDALHMGMVVVGNGRRIRTCSDLARRMFGRDVGLDPAGRLRLSDPMAQSLLGAMLTRRYDGPAHQRLMVGDMLVTLIRMEGERERSIFEGPGVCLTMEPMTGAGRFFDLDQFSRSYGLTGSEVRALTGLIAGKSIADIAREAGRSRETIRTQVKSLYSKTGARGEADLLRLISGMTC